MAATPAKVRSRVVELATEAFNTFCEDISGMFGVDIGCVSREVVVETISTLKQRFKKLVAVNFVNAKGVLDGTFLLIFDQGGLFTLSGVIVMLPENRILEEIKRGSIKDAQSMNDAMKEAGNLLIGTWDRIFREKIKGHDHFVQADTFIGIPWDNSEETLGLTNNEEIVFVPYEMTIGSYPAFNCGVIFPKKFFKSTFESNTEESDLEVKDKTYAHPDEKESATVETNDVIVEEKSKESTQDRKNSIKEDESKDIEKAERNDNNEVNPEGPAEEKNPTIEAAAGQKSDDVNTDVVDNVVKPETAVTTQTSESKKQPISETIRKMAHSPMDFTGRLAHMSSSICAKDIMEKEVLWSSPDDSVKQTLAKMQQADVSYVMIGKDGVLEGIVSRSNIAEAISPYLRPVFAKWRRPLDDATLHIKVKWIMSRPVRAIKPDMMLMAIVENMSQFGGRCLPVVDQEGKVQGLVTVFDIFKVMLNSNHNISTVGKTLQAPPLVQLDL